ncbi:hypothetical protein, partial [Rubinisphaera margarita]|uniref:hypothetical protein n=1 Tax=Rubinisphaera margarita TaxID=2909586 RepID=UPI001EE866A4
QGKRGQNARKLDSIRKSLMPIQPSLPSCQQITRISAKFHESIFAKANVRASNFFPHVTAYDG